VQSEAGFEFQICTIANRPAEVQAMRESFVAAGFDTQRCQYTVFDNSSGNIHDPFDELFKVCTSSAAPYIIFCHQDVRLNKGHGYDQLVAQLRELNQRDPAWAIAGNAGVDEAGMNVMRITDPRGVFSATNLPRRVYTLDENFLVIRTAAGIHPSRQLNGFHFYATDLCFNAMAQGKICYVIDFHLNHLSAGNTESQEFAHSFARFVDTWRPQLTCCVTATITGMPLYLTRYRPLRFLLSRHRTACIVRSRGFRFIPRSGAGLVSDAGTFTRIAYEVIRATCLAYGARIFKGSESG
jgi:hypothetical protein